MPEEKDINLSTNQTAEQGAPSRSSREEVALELMRFIAVTTGIGKTSTGAGFGGKPPKTPEEQVDALLDLYQRCRAVVEQKPKS